MTHDFYGSYDTFRSHTSIDIKSGLQFFVHEVSG